MCWRRWAAASTTASGIRRAQSYFLNGCDNLEPRVSKRGLQTAKPESLVRCAHANSLALPEFFQTGFRLCRGTQRKGQYRLSSHRVA